LKSKRIATETLATIVSTYTTYKINIQNYYSIKHKDHKAAETTGCFFNY
jgi:hypothetical protein